ncbi:MAG TPA: DUF4301 family protein [Thermoanaerobaculia bacterium]|nr:DUF4301 family protein [Thermoanaerobaculia bacterium]
MLLPRDYDQLRERGIRRETAEWQIAVLQSPPGAIVLDRPCTIGDGITGLPQEELESYRESANEAGRDGRIGKFVPASGAASRMFRDLITALEDPDRPPAAHEGAAHFFDRLEEFPFAELIAGRAGDDLRSLASSAEGQRTILTVLLEELGYADLPKALVPFHRNDERASTPFEEHLVEAAHYARDANGRCRVHYTVTPGHVARFERHLDAIRPEAESIANSRFDVTFSIQHPATDTLALAGDGSLFRLDDGSLLFRPGGHGALIRNLEELAGDLVVVKNIDNILPSHRMEDVAQWKRLLIGLAVQLQRRTFAILDQCVAEDCPPLLLDAAIEFAGSVFARRCPESIVSDEERRQFIADALDRPLRICGVVRNEGEPGGAPFWVRGPDGSTSIQIVESSQVNIVDPAQEAIWRSSTHFNPVDLVCALRDRRGEPFDLSRFVDPDAVFIAKKSHLGRDLLALELPGLWNGGMAGWNTICVEVPPSTFAPVKTVLDLLRPEHRASKS